MFVVQITQASTSDRPRRIGAVRATNFDEAQRLEQLINRDMSTMGAEVCVSIPRPGGGNATLPVEALLHIADEVRGELNSGPRRAKA